MFRIDNSTATATLAAATGAGPNPDSYFTDGDPATSVPATVVTAEWLNMMQEEVVNVITGAGLTLDKADRTQLRAALSAMMSGLSKSVIIENASFEASVVDGDVVRWDPGTSQFDEAVADGTSSNRAAGIADVTNGEVVCFGETRAGLMSGLTAGQKYYLDATTAGAVTATAPDDMVKIGIAKTANIIFIDIDAASVFDISGLTAEATPAPDDEVALHDSSAGALRKMTRQDFMAPDFISAEQTMTPDTLLNVAHGLGAVPSRFSVVLRCKSATFGYAVGDEILVGYGAEQHDSNYLVGADAANIFAVQGAYLSFIKKSTFDAGTHTAANWRWVFRAWK